MRHNFPNMHTVRSFMKDPGWQECGEWRWKITAPDGSSDNVDMASETDLGKIQHDVRESYRAYKWKDFLHERRRDAEALLAEGDLRYPAIAREKLRKMDLSPELVQ